MSGSGGRDDNKQPHIVLDLHMFEELEKREKNEQNEDENSEKQEEQGKEVMEEIAAVTRAMSANTMKMPRTMPMTHIHISKSKITTKNTNAAAAADHAAAAAAAAAANQDESKKIINGNKSRILNSTRKRNANDTHLILRSSRTSTPFYNSSSPRVHFENQPPAVAVAAAAAAATAGEYDVDVDDDHDDEEEDSCDSLSLEEIIAVVDKSHKLCGGGCSGSGGSSGGHAGLNHRVAAAIGLSIVVFPIMIFLAFGLIYLLERNKCRIMQFPAPHPALQLMSPIPAARVDDTFAMMRKLFDANCYTKKVSRERPMANTELAAFSDTSLNDEERDCMYSLRMFSFFGQIAPCYSVKQWPRVKGFTDVEGAKKMYFTDRRFAEMYEKSDGPSREIFCKRQCEKAFEIYKKVMIPEVDSRNMPATVCDGLSQECTVPKVVSMYAGSTQGTSKAIKLQ